MEIEVTEAQGRRLEASLTGGGGAVVLDLGAVSFIDSSGLRALLIGQDSITQGGGQLEVVNPSTVVRRLFQITGLGEKFGLQP